MIKNAPRSKRCSLGVGEFLLLCVGLANCRLNCRRFSLRDPFCLFVGEICAAEDTMEGAGIVSGTASAAIYAVSYGRSRNLRLCRFRLDYGSLFFLDSEHNISFPFISVDF